jgi:NADPH-dependent curcumin reductase CurA
MPTATNRRIVLAARPSGEPRDTDFRLEETAIAEPREGQILLRTLYLSLDPYMRGRMNEGPSYAPPVEIGEVMVGATLSEVAESKSPAFKRGDIVLANSGWQEYATATADSVSKLDSGTRPVSYALGVLGMPGMTAYTGLLNIGQPKPGETVVVAAAAGAVGSVVGQIAKIKGCRVAGIAGGKEKCEFVREQLGFDACVDHRSTTFAQDLQGVCSSGIDVYFENVGGAVFDAVLPLLNPFARIPVCGLISRYNASDAPTGPDLTPELMRTILVKRLTFRGFIVMDFNSQRAAFLRDMTGWVREGKVKCREDVVEGLQNAVGAFQGLLRGKNFGKLLVRFAQ